MGTFLLILVGLPLIIMTSCTVHPNKTAISYLDLLEPRKGIYFGVHLDWEQDSATAFNQRLGLPAAVYARFLDFPFSPTDLKNLDDFMAQVAQQRGIALITLEPRAGLETVTSTLATDLAKRLAAYNREGVPIIVRFGHEMNGSWYPWGQRPTEYVSAFRKVAEALHSHASLTATLWAPNYGGGYPFPMQRYEALPGSSDFQLLDTNHDGRLDMLDDMYAPYYPGDNAVDWVGLTLYHWGDQYPWGENEVPEANKFVASITGTYVGLNGDERTVPNFYSVYVEQHHKPMAIAETAAFYNPAIGGDSEQLIKKAWWRQVFNMQVTKDFPGIKMINWFELRKLETYIPGEVGTVIDWTITSKPEQAHAFLEDLPRSHFLFATDLRDIFP